MNKVEKDGQVAVLYSPGYGAGWSTWNGSRANAEQLTMDANIVNAFLTGGWREAAKEALKLFPDMYTGGAEQLEIECIPKGTAFEISEYDGYESINIITDKEYLVT